MLWKLELKLQPHRLLGLVDNHVTIVIDHITSGERVTRNYPKPETESFKNASVRSVNIDSNLQVKVRFRKKLALNFC